MLFLCILCDAGGGDAAGNQDLSEGTAAQTVAAVDIRCAGPEQLIRYSSILLDIADGTRREFDELIHEKCGTTWWLHFAVRPSGNRRKILFDMR